MPEETLDREAILREALETRQKLLEHQVAPPGPSAEERDAEDILKEAQATAVKAGIRPPAPLPPFQGFSFSTDFERPDPRPVPPEFSVLPKSMIENLPDEDEDARNKLWQSAGLELPSSKPSRLEKNKWSREYEQRLHRQDPVTWNLLVQSAGDPERREAVLRPYSAAMGLLYQVEKTPPSQGELSEGFRDAFRDWTTGKLVRYAKGSLRDTEAVPLPEAASRLDPDVVEDLHRRWVNDPRNLSGEDRRVLEAVRGEDFFAYWKGHQDFYLSRLRMEKLTGQKFLRDQPPQIFADQREIDRDPSWFTRFLTGERPPYLGTGLTTLPEVSNFRVEDLQAVSPFLQGLVQAAQGIRNQPAPPPEAPSLASPWRFIGLPTPGSLAKVAAKAGPYVGSALNLLTLGVFEAAHEGLQATGRSAAWAFQGDPKAYDAYAASIPSAMWKALVNGFDPKGSDAIAQFDRFMRDTYPLDSAVSDQLDSQARISSFEATRNALVRLSNDPSRTVSSLMRQSGLSDPEAQNAVAGLASGFVDDGTGLLLMALGSSTLWRAARGFPKFPELTTPVSKATTQVFTPQTLERLSQLDKTLAAEGVFSPIPATQRAPLLEYVQDALGKVKDPEVARDILGRLYNEVAARGPLDPQLSAAAVQTVKDLQAKLDLHGPKPLSPEFKRALAGAADPIADLGITEAGYVLRNQLVTVNPRESLRQAKVLQGVLEHLDTLSDQPAPAVLRTFRPGTWKDMVESAAETIRLKTEFLQKKEALGQLVDAMAAPLDDEIALRQLQQTHAEIGREAAVSNYNEAVRETFRRWQRLEFEGGERPSANPELARAMYRRMLDLKKVDPNPARTLLENPDLLNALAGPEAQALRKELRTVVGPLGDTDLGRTVRQRLDTWLEEHARPEIETRRPSETPRTELRDAIADAIQKTGKKPVSLTKGQLQALNEVREVPLDPAFTRKVLDSFDYDLRESKKSLKARQGFKAGLEDLRQHLQTLDPLKHDLGIRIPKDLRTAIEEELGSAPWELRDKGFVSLSPGLQDRFVNGLRLWKEATAEVSQDADLLSRGLHRFSALDFAIAGIQGPKQAIWLQRYHQKFAADLENLYRVQAKALDDFLGKKLSTEDRLRLNEKVRLGDTTDSDAARIIQKLQAEWLDDSYRTGRISPEEYQRYAQNVGYYHGIFERKDLARFPPPVYPVSPKLAPLKINPREFKQKIPERSFYVAWKEGDSIRMFPPSSSEVVEGKPIFGSAEAAGAWLERQNFPEGTEVGVHAPWTVDQKRAAGLIDEAGHSTMTLARQMGLNNAKAIVSRAMRYSGYALDEAAAKAAVDPVRGDFISGKGFYDRDGKRWFFMDEPENRWLNGRYVAEDYLNFLRFMDQDFKWRSLVGEKLGGMVRSNKLIPWIDRNLEYLIGRSKVAGAVGKVLGAGLHIFGLSKVALSPFMLPKQWISNFLWNLRLGGFETLSPYGFARYLQTGAKAFSSYKDVLTDPIWKGLASRRMIELGRTQFDAEITGSLQKHWKDVEPLKARLDQVNQRLGELAMDPAIAESGHVLEDLQRERLELTGLLDQKTRAVGQDFIPRLVSGGLRATSAVAKELTGRGPASRFLFNFVGFFDDLSKHQLVQHLMEDRGLTLESALDRAEMAMQNLNRVPDAVKGLSQRLGGSKFVTYPYNKLQTFAHALKHRLPWAVAQVAGLAAYNYAMIYAQRKNPQDELEGHALASGWGTSSWASDATYLLGRIKTPLGDMDSSPLFDVFMTQSPSVRRLEDQLSQGGENPYTQTATELALNVGSKFIGAGPVLDVYRQLVTGVDNQGHQVKSTGDMLRTLYQTLAPEWVPGGGGWGGRDWNEFWSWAATDYRRPFTGEKKSGREFLMRRILNLIPPGRENSAARFQGAMESVLSERPNRLRDIAGNAYLEHLDNYLYSKGAIREDGTPDMEKAMALTREWQAQEEHQGYFLTPEGKLPETVPEHKILEKATRAAQPGLFRAFSALTLSEEIDIYAYWRLHEPHPDPLLDQKLKALIGTKTQRAHPDLSDVGRNLAPALQSYLKDERMPADAKGQLGVWLQSALETAAGAKTIR